MASPISALLGYAADTNTWVICDNDQVWIAVWNLGWFLRRFSEDDDVWHTLFNGSLLDLISAPKEVEFPGTRVPGDMDAFEAVSRRLDAINWDTRPYVVGDTMDFLQELNPSHREIATIDAKQLAATCVITVRGVNPRKSCCLEQIIRMYWLGPTRVTQRWELL